MLNKFKPLLLLLLLSQASFAINDGGGFLINPSAAALGDKSFEARGTLGYHYSNSKSRHPFVGSFRYGVFDSFELGLHFGSTISLDVKDQLRVSEGAIPAVAIGARAFVQSPEAYFYAVSKEERKNQTGEFYTSVLWNTDWWNILGGVSVFPTMDADAVAPFWGFEQKFGSKFSIVYEGFFRHGYTHHNTSLLLKPVKSLQISAGATEAYRYILDEDGNFTFRMKNRGAKNGYRTPGVYMSIAILGILGDGPKPITSCQCKRNMMADTIVIDSATRDSIKLDSILKGEADYPKDIKDEFEEIVQGYFVTDLNLDTLLAKEEFFMGKGLMSRSFVLAEAQNKEAEANRRITAIRVMSHFPDSMYIEPLGSIIEKSSDSSIVEAEVSSNEAIAREAALALGTINSPEARKMLSSVVSKTSGIVRTTIMEILGEL